MGYDEDMPRSLACTVALAVALGCASSAPYTVPSAAINTALAAGASAGQVAAGGCYAVCVYGTVCNPKTGFCERDTAAPCAAGTAADPRCAAPVPVFGIEQGARVRPTGGSTSPIGVSPETGRAPPPPGQRDGDGR